MATPQEIQQQAGAAASRAARNAADEPEINYDAKTSPCSLEGGGRRVMFPITADTLDSSNRIVRHERPYRPGAKLDSTGSSAIGWNLDCLFNNTIEEPGVTNDGLPLYPDAMQLLLDIAREGAVLDMIHPIDGKRRVRVERLSRRRELEMTDTGVVQLTLVEDSEESVTSQDFRPAVSGSLIRLARDARFSAAQEGVWSDDVQTFAELCGQIEGLVRAPGEALDAVRAQVRGALRAAVSVIETAREEASRPVQTNSIDRDTNESPVNVVWDFVRAADSVAIAVGEKSLSGQPDVQQRRLVPYEVREPTTALALAAAVGQPLEAILDANAQRIDDPMDVQPGTYRVWSSWP